MALALTPRLLRRGLELFAGISLAAVAALFAYYLIRFGDRLDVFLTPFLTLHWGWMLVGLALASMDWIGVVSACGSAPATSIPPSGCATCSWRGGWGRGGRT